MVSNWLRVQRLFAILMFLHVAARAQTAGSNAGQSPSQPQPEGRERGGYVIHQSMEFGYRVSDITGSEQMYNTLVDLRTATAFPGAEPLHAIAKPRQPALRQLIRQ